MPLELRAPLVMWALGFGGFVALLGSAVVAPPDPVTQLFVAAALLVVVAPVVFAVFEAGRIGTPGERSLRPFPYFVAATVGSVAAGLFVPLGAVTGGVAVVVRAVAFLAVFGLVSWVAARRAGRDPSAGSS